jgi:glycosyltransferase involved in cell wall biosynthesis
MSSSCSTAARQRVVEDHPKHSLLMVGNFLSESFGTRSVCDDLSMRLRSRGWPVLTTSDRLFRPARLLDMLGTCWLHRRQYDVTIVDVYSGAAFRWAETVCQLLRHIGKPHILTLHGGGLPEFSRTRRRRVGRLLRTASAVTTPSRYLQTEMRPYCHDLQLVPNPLDVGIYRFRERTRAMPRLVWLRKFHNLYNPSLGPRVVAILKDSFPDLQLTMNGPDKGDGSLAAAQRTAEELKVAHHVRFRGSVPAQEVPSQLESGDIFLNTASVDNTPVSVLEAMASGLCIVSTNVGGIPYLLEHEHDSLLVPPGDPGAMAAAIRRILTEPALARRLSANARRKACSFDWSKILPQWERLLRVVAATRRKST